MSELIVQIGKGLLLVILTAYFTLEMQTSEKSRSIDRKRFFVIIYKLFLLGTVIWAIYTLGNKIVSPDPLTRIDVFLISFYVSYLFFIAIIYLINRIVNNLDGMINSIGGIVENQKEQSDNFSRLLSVVEKKL